MLIGSCRMPEGFINFYPGFHCIYDDISLKTLPTKYQWRY